MIIIIPNFTNAYWDISLWIINNQYRSMCRLSTWITHRSLVLNAPIHFSMISWGVLFHSSTMACFKELRSVILRPRYTFCSKSPPSPQNLLDSNLDYSVSRWDSSNRNRFFSFNISRANLTVWDLAPFCMNKYLLCFTSVFILGIIFFNSTLK